MSLQSEQDAHPDLHPVFVYGTLLRGERNHRLLTHARFVGEDLTEPGFELAHLGGFPGMCAAREGTVAGEVYAVDAGTLAELDRLEDHPRFYLRTWIRLASGAHVEAYLLRREQVADCPRIPSGSWRRRDEVRAERERRR